MTEGPQENRRLAGSVLLDDGLLRTLRRLPIERGDLLWENVRAIEVGVAPKAGCNCTGLSCRASPRRAAPKGA